VRRNAYGIEDASETDNVKNSDPVRIIHGAAEARAGILRRAPLEESEPPEHVRARDRMQQVTRVSI
jgi:hypothetical protein